MGKSFPQGFFEVCRAQVEPLKAEMEAKEKEKYPNQQSAMPKDGDRSGGPNTAGNGPQPMDKKVDCAKVTSEIRKAADSCINTKDQAKRKACFDKIGEKVESSGAGQACGETINAMKSEYMAKEAKMFPNQPASMQ